MQREVGQTKKERKQEKRLGAKVEKTDTTLIDRKESIKK
jgi:hypothetical protein